MLMAESFYFSHDYNARSDDKIKALIRKHGMEGYGVWWSIIEDLYNNANALRSDCDGIAFDLRVHCDLVKSVLNDFDLFVFDGDKFGSLSVQKRLDERDLKSKKAAESARKRWDVMRTQCERNANAMRTLSDGNAIKERKGKEIKGNKGKEKMEQHQNNNQLLATKSEVLLLTSTPFRFRRKFRSSSLFVANS